MVADRKYQNGQRKEFDMRGDGHLNSNGSAGHGESCRMAQRAWEWLNEDRGAGLAEYALLLLLIAIVCVGALTGLGGTISGAFNQANGMF